VEEEEEAAGGKHLSRWGLGAMSLGETIQKCLVNICKFKLIFKQFLHI
jgi:hypothetical protein